MRAFRHLGLPLLACALASSLAQAEAPCRVAYDIGSSGIRAGASNSDKTTRAGIDYLAALREHGSLDASVEPTIAALAQPYTEGLFSAACARVGGGFSAWRLALRLATSHVLDIGGGSLQVAGEKTTFGDAIGQKLWHQQVCQALAKPGGLPCSLSPMTADELATVRALLAKRLENVGASLRGPVTMTAISRPVTHGVAPAVERLLDRPPGSGKLSRADLGRAIGQLAGMTLEDTAARLGIAPTYAAYLLSDMLLVEGLMQAAGAADIKVAEVDLTNIPGLLADDRAYRWADNYGCYLLRLARDGLDAYGSDPESCYARDPAGKPER
jgi:hypothetical protein